MERPGTGEDARHTAPKIDGVSIGYAILNRGKKSIALDLKAEGAVESLRPLIEKVDVLVEQFRPGVMDRLGLGYEAMRTINPGIVYCSITGYGQTGPKRDFAGHDLNYVGDAGILSLSRGPDEQPTMPFALVADVGGGSYPAVLNILLALRERDRTGQGIHLDIAMAEGAFVFAYWAHAKGVVAGEPISNGADRLTGGLARYRLYSAADGRQIAVAALEVLAGLLRRDRTQGGAARRPRRCASEHSRSGPPAGGASGLALGPASGPGRLLLHGRQDPGRGGIRRPFCQAWRIRPAGANRGTARTRPAAADRAGFSRAALPRRGRARSRP